MKKSKTYRELQFENEHVSVWKTVISPDQPLEKHRHDVGRVIVGLKGGKIKRIDANGLSSDLQLDTHKAYWLHADDQHEDINLGSDPIEVMVIEMKKPKDRPLPSIPID